MLVFIPEIFISTPLSAILARYYPFTRKFKDGANIPSVKIKLQLGEPNKCQW